MKMSFSRMLGCIALMILSAASLHSLRCDAAQVVAWGDNSYGQTNVPTDLTNAISISAGQNFSLALRANGTVAAWGDNSSGQTNVPEDLSNVVAVAAGGYHALALKSDGTVIAWGAGMTDAEIAPDFGQSVVPQDLTNVVAIAGGLYHSMALRADGSVVVWGNNSRSQTNVPASVTNVFAIAAGDYHCVAVRVDRSVRAWGDNSSGQTNVLPSYLSYPYFAPQLAQVAAGTSHSVILSDNGSIISWGSQKTVPPALFGYGTIINLNSGTTETSVTKNAALDGNVVINGNANGPIIVYGGANGLAVSANSRVNYNTNYLRLPASAYSAQNSGTGNEIPYPATNLYDFNRFIAAAELTPNLYNSNTHNNHFTNVLSFINAANAHTNSAHAMEGVVVVDISTTDKNYYNITDKNIPNGVNVKGSLLLNFTGGNWDPVYSKVIITAAINVNAADLSGLVATNPATYTSGYPPNYADPTKNPTNIDITSRGFTNFVAGEELPALMGTIGVMDIHGSADVCGTFYTPSYMEIENKNNSQTQYFRGKLIMGYGVYLENVVSNSTSIFSSESPSSSGNVVGIAAKSGHNLALNSSGHVAAWGDQTYVPTGLSNVAAIAAGGSHNLALVGDSAPVFSSQAVLSNTVVDIGGFHFSVQTQNGKVYATEYRDSLTDDNWIAWPLVAGNGDAITFTDPGPTNDMRFYRVRQW